MHRPGSIQQGPGGGGVAFSDQPLLAAVLGYGVRIHVVLRDLLERIELVLRTHCSVDPIPAHDSRYGGGHDGVASWQCLGITKIAPQNTNRMWKPSEPECI